MFKKPLLVNPSATSEEVEKMIESGNSQQIFSGQIMHAGQRNEAKRALQDIQNKHRDVQRIEKSIIVSSMYIYLCLINKNLKLKKIGVTTIIYGSKCFISSTR